MSVLCIFVCLGKPVEDLQNDPLTTWSFSCLDIVIITTRNHQKFWDRHPLGTPPNGRQCLRPSNAVASFASARKHRYTRKTAVPANTLAPALHGYSPNDHRCHSRTIR
mmetsp:Transcript_36245/g.84990  ORF Transcript_36245/g.84990 Transcript_36245/m.84990 type:complete len:108 (-) Transcript_36245:1301-1624(-)